jgi:hypothetical protein
MGVMAILPEQVNFRFRNDDGNETTATWRAAETTNDSIAVSTTFRLRTKMRERGGGGAVLFGGDLFYSKNGGAYTAITTSSSNIKLVTSSNVADGTATTEQLTSTGAYNAGSVDSDGSVTDVGCSLSSTEFEHVLQLVSGDVSPGDTIDFEMDTGTLGIIYTAIPRMTVASGGGGTSCKMEGMGVIRSW